MRKMGIILMCITPFVWGMEKSKAGVYFVGSFDFTSCFLNVNGLNKELKRYGIEKLSTRQDCWGKYNDELSAIIGSIILGAQEVEYEGESAKSESLEVRADFRAHFMKFGYFYSITHRLGLAPFLSVGLFRYNLDLIPIFISEVDFDSLLSGAGAKRICSMSTMQLGLSLGGKVFFTLFKFKGVVPIGLSLQASYPLWCEKADWELKDGKLLKGAPKLSLNCPFISLGLVFGGKRKEEGK